MKLDESLADITKRLETVEKMDTGSNQAKEDVKKSDGGGKEVFWKSFLGTPSEE